MIGTEIRLACGERCQFTQSVGFAVPVDAPQRVWFASCDVTLNNQRTSITREASSPEAAVTALRAALGDLILEGRLR